MRILRRRPSPAMIVALIALFIALGGPAQAKRALIDGNLLRKSSVTTRAIKNGTVAKADLSKRAVKSLMATPNNSVRTQQIVDGQVLAPDLGASSVTATALAPGAVSASKLATGSVGGGSVANGSLQTVDIGSFAGAISVDFAMFTDAVPCQATDPSPPATPTGGQPNIADDVVLATPPAGWPDNVLVMGKPAPNNTIRIAACKAPLTPDVDPPPTVFRYVTFDSP